MNKRLIKICITLLVLATLASTQILSASALISPYRRGDVNYDYSIDIDDVTLLQKYLANTIDLSKRSLYGGEVNGDGKLNIDDVTMIQKYCAEMIKSFNTEDAWLHTVEVYNFYSDYNSGKAPVDTPITFYAEGWGGVEPFTYEFYVDDVLVSERAETDNFSYTFDEKGIYNITVRIYNAFDEYDKYTQQFEVVDEYPSEQPVISSIYFNKLKVEEYDFSLVLTANAVLGNAPYEYKFSIDDGAYVQDFSENNKFDFGSYMYELYKNDDTIGVKHYVGEYTVEISVRDSTRQITTEDFSFLVNFAMIG